MGFNAWSNRKCIDARIVLNRFIHRQYDCRFVFHWNSIRNELTLWFFIWNKNKKNTLFRSVLHSGRVLVHTFQIGKWLCAPYMLIIFGIFWNYLRYIYERIENDNDSDDNDKAKKRHKSVYGKIKEIFRCLIQVYLMRMQFKFSSTIFV